MKDAGLGFLHTIIFALIIIVVLFGVMLLMNYVAAPVLGA